MAQDVIRSGELSVRMNSHHGGSSTVEILSQRLTTMEEQLALLRCDLKEAVEKLKRKEREVVSAQNQVTLAKRQMDLSESSKSARSFQELKDESCVSKTATKLESECQILARKVQEMEQFFGDYGLMWITEDALMESDPKKLWVRKSNIHYTPNFDKIFVVVEELNVANSEQQIVKKKNSAEFKNVDLLNLTLYADGMQLENNPFRMYESPSVQEFFRDLEDGYFPSELKCGHPEGVMFKVKDKRHIKFADDPDKKRFVGVGQPLGGRPHKNGSISISSRSIQSVIRSSGSVKDQSPPEPVVVDGADIPKSGSIKMELFEQKNSTPSKEFGAKSKNSVRSGRGSIKSYSSHRRMSLKTKQQSASKEIKPPSKVASSVEKPESTGKVHPEVDNISVVHELANEVTAPSKEKEPEPIPQFDEDKLEVLFTAPSPNTSVRHVPQNELMPSPAQINNSEIGSSMSKMSTLPAPPPSPSIGKMPSESKMSDIIMSPKTQLQPAVSKNEETQTNSIICLKGKKNEPTPEQPQPISHITNITIKEGPVTIYTGPSESKKPGHTVVSGGDKEQQTDVEIECPPKLTTTQVAQDVNCSKMPGETEYREEYSNRASIRSGPKREPTPQKYENFPLPPQPATNYVDPSVRYRHFTFLGLPKDQAATPIESEFGRP